MDKKQTVARIELTDALRKEPRPETGNDVEQNELEIDELEQRITPTSIDPSIGTFF
ncbi:MAG TPA: hypothetical protein VL524_09790 [Gemmatimonadaceae bacterium]|jgi:hypothetical protein|nr:hypothetical protein [Gemmatimonadaceae bacterium]